MVDTLSEHVELLRRQYLQLIQPDELTLPPTAILKTAETQSQIFTTLFRDGNLRFPPTDRYRSRVLKLLVNTLEQSVSEPDEDVRGNMHFLFCRLIFFVPTTSFSHFSFPPLFPLKRDPTDGVFPLPPTGDIR